LGPRRLHDSAPKRHLGRFIRFCSAPQCPSHIVTYTLQRLRYIAAKHGVCIHAYADDLHTYISCAASDQNTTTSRLLTVVSDIDRWISSNRLKLNAGKTEVALLGTRQQLTKLNMSPLQIKNQVIMPLDKVRDLGVIIDSKLTLTMESHTASVARSCFYQLRSIQRSLTYTYTRHCLCG